MSGVLRVGNCSGFYGDRLSAMREMLEGGQLDVLTGDYLAELTMLILGRDQLKDPGLGYARTFVTQVEDCLALALERRVAIVANAGGLNPAGLAARLRDLAASRGVAARIAYVAGDDLLDRADDLSLADGEKPLTANAYLGAFGIAAALQRAADIVVTGRVTDASLVVGPAIARFGWSPTAYDQLAGAVVAGHVLECGTQATGGNFSGFGSLVRGGAADRPLGFPIAEIAADGSSVVTKHPGTGGVVSVDTVTAQLMYEIGSTDYLNPDVTTHLETVALATDGNDRVRISGVRGSAPPATAKVGCNVLGGFRNSVELVITGLDVETKADWVRRQAEAAWSSARPAVLDWSLARTDHPDAATEETASARLRVAARDPSPDRVGKAFTAPLVELALASYPGFTMTAPPGPGTPYGVYRAAYVPQSALTQVVHHADGSVQEVPPPRRVGANVHPKPAESARTYTEDRTTRAPLGSFVHARSGDKGADANLGLWVSSEGSPALVARRTQWLLGLVTPQFVRALLPETAALDVETFALPNLHGVNVVIHGLLGDGVAATSRFDPQAKGLGEWARSRLVDVPEDLL